MCISEAGVLDDYRIAIEMHSCFVILRCGQGDITRRGISLDTAPDRRTLCIVIAVVYPSVTHGERTPCQKALNN
jgi:hypothetical protein